MENEDMRVALGKVLARGEETQRQLMKIDATLERVADHHEQLLARVAALEIHNAEHTGGTRMLLLLSGAAATIGGLAATIFGRLWGGA